MPGYDGKLGEDGEDVLIPINLLRGDEGYPGTIGIKGTEGAKGNKGEAGISAEFNVESQGDKGYKGVRGSPGTLKRYKKCDVNKITSSKLLVANY